MAKNIILIGGMPTAGKSSLARALSKRLDIPWISTDQIREVMRVVADRSEHPKLFTPEGYDAERFLTEFSAQQIVDMEFEQGDETWPGVRKLIEDDYTWSQGFIIEGINILPHLVTRDCADNSAVRAVFLSDENEDTVRKVAYTRGIWGDPTTYSDAVKEKEVEWSLLFNKRLRREVEKYRHSWVEVEKNEDDLHKLIRAVGLPEL